MLSEKIKSILLQIEKFEKSPSADYRLPQNSFYLEGGEVVCCPRENGESRYPYDSDGLVVWARSSGYIEACESTFTIFKPVHFSDDPSVNFFAGIPLDNGEFYPISVTGAGRQLFEPLQVRRYTVYSQRCAYYIADTDTATFALRVHTDKNKHIHFTQCAVNKTKEKISFYLCACFDALLRFCETESFWDRMSKFGSRYDMEEAYILRSGEHCLVINTASQGGTVTGEYHTVDKNDVMGFKGRTLANAQSLRTGKYNRMAHEATTTEIPMAGDIFHYDLETGGEVCREYDLSYYHTLEEARKNVGVKPDADKTDRELAAWEESERAELSHMTVTFDDWQGGVNSNVLNRFVRSVQKQTSFCALGKNYAGPHIGIRDVFQQLEGSLIWQPERSREKIVVALNYILENGRPPRQFSVPAVEGDLPELDLREYIDQGVWIISTIYTYLCYTDDYSILDEQCSYYVVHPDNWLQRKSDITDSVLSHMLKIMDFLASNLDREYGTNCLRALYGDWNDALDGLGKTKDPGKKYGSGVTVMATLQFYQNCREMTELLTRLGGYEETVARYREYMDGIEKGLFENAIVTNGQGERRIVHGWGDKISYKLGSFSDPDGKSRRSLTSNSFWAICGMVSRDESLKPVIVDTVKAMDSKYGLLTFDVPFPPDMEEAGRLASITPGTYENCCAYVHASMFAVMALFALGESGEAWRQMEKSMVISHDNCTMTTFAMPNSYCCNPEYEIDGGSMGDWYTGSGAVLVKELIRYGFGVAPTLDGLTLQTPRVMPCRSGHIDITVKGCPITVSYKNEGKGKRSYKIDGREAESVYDCLMDTRKLFIPACDIKSGMKIEVSD